jgi:LCP family protein required for cell wall assembly
MPTRKKHPVRRVLACAAILVLLAGGLCYALLYATAGRVTVRALAQEDSKAVSAAAKGSVLVTNILLLGVDSESVAGARSDTMLLLSIDHQHRKLKLTSFLRESWVNFPDGSAAKLNAACSLGGAPLAMRAIAGNFQVRIDHYMLVDFAGFERIIDALGGIAVPVTDSEADFLCKKTRLGKQIGRTSMREQMQAFGAVRFTGEQALIYCRIRKLDDDFMRTQRQRKVLECIAAACQKNPLRAAGSLQKALAELETDMGQAALANLAASALLALQYQVEQHQVPAQGTWQYGTKKGASVILFNAEDNAALLREFIYE